MDLSSFVLIVDEHIKRALREDITSEDVSTAAVMPKAHRGTVELIAKQDGVIAGLQVFERTFKILDPTARFDAAVSDGQRISSGQLLGVVHADVRALLSGERVALNYLQRMSGIATKTRQAVDALADAGSKTVIAVSYTHLDVYKRQRQERRGAQAQGPGSGYARRSRGKTCCIRAGRRASFCKAG